MKDISTSNFGLLIAYALPGYIVVWGIGSVLQPEGICTGPGCSSVASLVGFMTTTVAAVAAGMAVSAVRYVLIDSIHSALGLRRPPADGTALQHNHAAVTTSIEQHYRYYQFHANMLIAGAIAYAAHLYTLYTFPGLLELLLVGLAGTFWLAARDNLSKYYHDIATIRSPYTNGVHAMSNGKHHDDPKPPRQPQQSQTRDWVRPRQHPPADEPREQRKPDAARG
jgi:hypothetical protein